MNRTTSPETPAGNHCPNMTVLELQRASHNWQLQQQQGSCRNYFGPGLNSGGTFCMTSQGLLVADVMKLDPDTYNSWPDFRGYELNYGIIPKTPGYKPSVPLPPVSGMQVTAEEKVKESVLVYGKRCQARDERLGRMKFDKLNIFKTEDDNGEKKMKGSIDKAEHKLTAQSNNDCKNNNKETNSKNSHVQKQDYIHVRAHRGQATDSHSLAERARREKISKRMKFLQDLVPGCNKITGKAGMLDEIINYVQSLQRQVEFLSMELAVVNPRLDIDIDSLFAKEITPACTHNFPSIDMPSDLPTQGFLNFNPTNQLDSHAGVAFGIDPKPGIWRTISSPLQATEKFLELSNFPKMQDQSATLEDISLQNLYNVEFQQ